MDFRNRKGSDRSNRDEQRQRTSPVQGQTEETRISHSYRGHNSAEIGQWSIKVRGT